MVLTGDLNFVQFEIISHKTGCEISFEYKTSVLPSSSSSL
jgi:hypothetical protein